MTAYSRHLIPVAAATAALLSAACSGDSAGPATGSVRVTFSVSSAPGQGAGLAFASDTLVGPGSDTLVLDSVQLVLRDIRFKRVEDSACDDDDDQGEDNLAALHDDQGEDGPDDDACESYNAGPFLLDVPLDPGVTKAFSVAVDTGTYDELRIRIHKPEDNGDPRDADFLLQHPAFAGISIRTVGTWNGAPFTYTTDLSAEQRMNLVPPLAVVTALSQVNVTIQVDVAAWFADGSGGYVDPSTANAGGLNEQLVERNIQTSFNAFKDDDHDGHDDDDTGHGGNDDD